MWAEDFNKGWKWRHLRTQAAADGSDAYGKDFREVTVPHDAMIGELRTPEAPSAESSGWFEGHDYEYIKDFVPDPMWDGKTLMLEFEGVYHDPEVWVNGELVASRPYGYTNFLVNVTDLFRQGQENQVRVVARNADQPNSRWYSGAGIYRPVVMWVGEPGYIVPNEVHISTVSIDPPVIEIVASTVGGTQLTAEIQIETESGSQTFTASADVAADRTVLQMALPGAGLWSAEKPILHQCNLVLESGEVVDTAQTRFGIRSIDVGNGGFKLNGKRVILQGACIHHDNGILGARTHPDAEERKIRLLQASGYNAIRSAHNPCSKALLDACDRLGMLVMDEYADQWYIHKTRYDYASNLEHWWRDDLRDMVNKDFNHPSVIMYSIGNEVAETAQKKGITLTHDMTEYLHSLDPTRPVTCGINIFFNFLSSMGFGVYSDEKAKSGAASTGRVRKDGVLGRLSAVGSEFYNNLAGIVGADFMKLGAKLPPCDARTRDAFGALDVAGYNYGIRRYRQDLKKYPNRLILGTETFCADAYQFREEAKRSPRLIGDFVWAGMDHLGEVAIGAWEYPDYAPNDSGFGWLTASQGRLDLTGKSLGESLYTRVALETDPGPFIAVRPVNHTGARHTPSSWRMTNARPTWSWNGCVGKKAEVEVYSRADSVALVLNGQIIGKKQLPKGDCKVVFRCDWQPGKITAISLDKQGRETGRCSLVSALNTTELRAEPESEAAYPGGLVYVRLRYTDENGVGKPLERGTLKVEVTGAELAGLGSAAPYNLESFLTSDTDTYFGEALAILEVPQQPAQDRILFSVSDGTNDTQVSIPIVSEAK